MRARRKERWRIHNNSTEVEFKLAEMGAYKSKTIPNNLQLDHAVSSQKSPNNWNLHRVEIWINRYRRRMPKVQTLDDLLELLDNLRPWEEGVGVIGLERPMSQFPGDSRAAWESLSVEASSLMGCESSRVLGTYTHRFNPKASFALRHLLPISLYTKLWNLSESRQGSFE